MTATLGPGGGVGGGGLQPTPVPDPNGGGGVIPTDPGAGGGGVVPGTGGGGGGGGVPGGTGDGPIGGGTDGDSGSGSGTGSGSGRAEGGFLFNMESYNAVRSAHASLACLSFALLFPLGGMLLRHLPLSSGRANVILHASWQVTTLCAAIAAMGCGIYLGRVSHRLDTTHAIIGLVAVCGLVVQPFTGILHHALFQKRGRRTAVTYSHLLWGISLVTLGIVNGGLGLQLAGERTYVIVMYGVFAGLVWATWLATSAFVVYRRAARRREIEDEKIGVAREGRVTRGILKNGNSGTSAASGGAAAGAGPVVGAGALQAKDDAVNGGRRSSSASPVSTGRNSPVHSGEPAPSPVVGARTRSGRPGTL